MTPRRPSTRYRPREVPALADDPAQTQHSWTPGPVVRSYCCPCLLLFLVDVASTPEHPARAGQPTAPWCGGRSPRRRRSSRSSGRVWSRTPASAASRARSASHRQTQAWRSAGPTLLLRSAGTVIGHSCASARRRSRRARRQAAVHPARSNCSTSSSGVWTPASPGHRAASAPARAWAAARTRRGSTLTDPGAPARRRQCRPRPRGRHPRGRAHPHRNASRR